MQRLCAASLRLLIALRGVYTACFHRRPFILRRQRSLWDVSIRQCDRVAASIRAHPHTGTQERRAVCHRFAPSGRRGRGAAASSRPPLLALCLRPRCRLEEVTAWDVWVCARAWVHATCSDCLAKCVLAHVWRAAVKKKSYQDGAFPVRVINWDLMDSKIISTCAVKTKSDYLNEFQKRAPYKLPLIGCLFWKFINFPETKKKCRFYSWCLKHFCFRSKQL